MNADSHTLANIVRYAASNIYRQGLGLLTAFVRPKLLSPELFGLWSLLVVIPNYASYAHLGARSIMRFKVPWHAARGEEQALERVTGATYWGSLMGSGIVVVGILGVLAWPNLPTYERLALGLIALMVLGSWHYEFHISLLKGRERFGLVSAANMVRATALLLFTLALIIPFGIDGALAALVLSVVVGIGFLMVRGGVETVGRFHGATFRALIHEGFPVMLFNLITVLLRTADKILVAALLGNRQLGYYGISAMVVGALMNIPGVSREVIEPQLMRSLKDQCPRATFQRFFHQPVVVTAMFMPLLVGSTWLLLPPLIEQLLSNYLPGLAPARLLTLGAFFLALSFPARGMVVAHGWQRGAVLAGAIAVLVNLGLGWWFIQLGWGIDGVALASVLSFVSMLTALLLYLMVQLQFGWRDMFPTVWVPVVVFLAMVALLHGVEAVAQAWWTHVPGTSLLALGLYLPPAGGLALAGWHWSRRQRG